MVHQSLVVAYDGSQPAKKALDTAVEMCRENPARELRVISAVGPDIRMFPAANPVVYNAEEYQSMQKQCVDKQRALLETDVRPLVADLPNHVELTVVTGDSAADIIDEYAKKHDADLIIMGSRGLSGIRGTIGSVSRAVLSRCCTPVLIVKG